MIRLIKGLLFDLDGTLLDRSESLKQFVTSQYKRFLIDSKVSMNTYINDFLQLDENGYNTKQNVYQGLVEKYDLDSELRDFLLQDYYSRFHDHCLPVKGLDAMLKFLKESNLKIGLITNGRENFQSRTIEGLALNDLFHSVLISESEGLKKPSPEFFKRGLEQLGIQAEETIFIGDHPINDIKAAKDLKMKTIWVEGNYYEKPVYADYTIQSLSSIPEIVKSLNREDS